HAPQAQEGGVAVVVVAALAELTRRAMDAVDQAPVRWESCAPAMPEPRPGAGCEGAVGAVGDFGPGVTRVLGGEDAVPIGGQVRRIHDDSGAIGGRPVAGGEVINPSTPGDLKAPDVVQHG